MTRVAFQTAVSELGRFIDRAEQLPRQTRAASEQAHGRFLQVSEQIIGLTAKNKEIYVDDVAIDPQAKSLVSFLM